jgi:hypothetical protein
LFLAAGSIAALATVLIFTLKFLIKPAKQETSQAKEVLAH